MEHKSLDRIRAVADVLPSWLGVRPLSKCERLERWAEAPEREGGRRLKTLFEIEYVTPLRRRALRADDSPLNVAFKDPTLRAQGLAGDTVGDATAFFGISEWEIHNILCFCHHGDTMSAEVAAMRVRAAAIHYARYTVPRGRAMVFGSFMAVLAAIGVLVA
ncbi:MAG: hypothetical protein ACREEV_11940 [Dongiaceae bacterium]